MHESPRVSIYYACVQKRTEAETREVSVDESSEGRDREEQKSVCHSAHATRVSLSLSLSINIRISVAL